MLEMVWKEKNTGNCIILKLVKNQEASMYHFLNKKKLRYCIEP